MSRTPPGRLAALERRLAALEAARRLDWQATYSVCDLLRQIANTLESDAHPPLDWRPDAGPAITPRRRRTSR